MVIVHAGTYSSFSVRADSNCQHSFSNRSSKSLLDLAVFYQADQGFRTELSGYYLIWLLMVVNWKNVVGMLCDNLLSVIGYIVIDKDGCSMEDENILVGVIKILSAVLAAIPLNIFQLQLRVGCIGILLRILLVWLFNCSQPRLNGHELIALVMRFEELLHFSRLHFSGYSLPWNIYILVQILQSIRLLIIFCLCRCFNFFCTLNVPNYNGPVKTAYWNQVVWREPNFGDMRAMAVVLFRNLLRYIAWISEKSNCLVVISNCKIVTWRISADTIHISIIDSLEYSLHWPSEFAGPTGPVFIS